MFENYDDILSPEDVSEALHIGMKAIYELLRTKKIKAFRNGRNWRIPKSSLVKYINENCCG